jgi:hypothetical protein
MKFVLACLVFGAFLFVGCDSGGGGDSGTGATTAPITISGNADVPVSALDSWATSIRGAFDYTRLTARAYGVAGNLLGEAALKSDKTFFITLTSADADVTVKITSVKGFEFSKVLGPVTTAGTAVGTVDATTTCQLLMHKEYGMATDTTSVAFTTLLTAFVNSLSVSTALNGGTIVDALKTSQLNTMTTFKNSQSAIKNNFAWVEAALKARSVTETVKYFSLYYTSSDASLAATVTLDNFKTVTQDRFNRYTIDAYTFNVEKILFTDSTTAVAVGTAYIAVTGISDRVPRSIPLTNLRVVWRMENGSWVIYKDFPYQTSQLGF